MTAYGGNNRGRTLRIAVGLMILVLLLGRGR